MTPQHLVEHLEDQYRYAAGQMGEFEIATPAEHLEKYRETIFNHKPMPRGHQHPMMKKGENETLRHPDMETAKAKLRESMDAFETYFKQHPDTRTKNVVFGMMDKFEWDLLANKHFAHHFAQFGIL